MPRQKQARQQTGHGNQHIQHPACTPADHVVNQHDPDVRIASDTEKTTEDKRDGTEEGGCFMRPDSGRVEDISKEDFDDQHRHGDDDSNSEQSGKASNCPTQSARFRQIFLSRHKRFGLIRHWGTFWRQRHGQPLQSENGESTTTTRDVTVRPLKPVGRRQRVGARRSCPVPGRICPSERLQRAACRLWLIKSSKEEFGR